MFDSSLCQSRNNMLVSKPARRIQFFPLFLVYSKLPQTLNILEIYYSEIFLLCDRVAFCDHVALYDHVAFCIYAAHIGVCYSF